MDVGEMRKRGTEERWLKYHEHTDRQEEPGCCIAHKTQHMFLLIHSRSQEEVKEVSLHSQLLSPSLPIDERKAGEGRNQQVSDATTIPANQGGVGNAQMRPRVKTSQAFPYPWEQERHHKLHWLQGTDKVYGPIENIAHTMQESCTLFEWMLVQCCNITLSNEKGKSRLLI